MSQSEDIVELRNCISVLFSFERRPIADEVFVEHLREWTERLVSPDLWKCSVFYAQGALSILTRVLLELCLVPQKVVCRFGTWQ